MRVDSSIRSDGVYGTLFGSILSVWLVLPYSTDERACLPWKDFTLSTPFLLEPQRRVIFFSQPEISSSLSLYLWLGLTHAEKHTRTVAYGGFKVTCQMRWNFASTDLTSESSKSALWIHRREPRFLVVAHCAVNFDFLCIFLLTFCPRRVNLLW